MDQYLLDHEKEKKMCECVYIKFVVVRHKKRYVCQIQYVCIQPHVE